MSISLDAFRPYVEPYVEGVTRFEVLFNTREVLRDFCTRTKCWQVLIPSFQTDSGVSEYKLDPPIGTVISQVEEVYRGSVPIAFAGMDDLTAYFGTNWINMTSSPLLKATFMEPGTLVVHGPPDETQDIYVRAAVKPNATDTLIDVEIPDFMFEQWATQISNGVLSRLYAIPKKPYSDPRSAGERAGRYEIDVANIKIRVARSFGRQELESIPRYY
jgi:hypothetical protein